MKHAYSANLVARPPAKMEFQFFPLNIDNPILSIHSNCEFLLGGGNQIYGATLSPFVNSYLIDSGGGVIVDLLSGESYDLRDVLPKKSEIIGFEPEGQWIYVLSSRSSTSTSLFRYFPKTRELAPLKTANGRIDVNYNSVRVSKTGQFVLAIEDLGSEGHKVHRWDFGLTHSTPKEYHFSGIHSPALNPLLSNDGNTFAIQHKQNTFVGRLSDTHSGELSLVKLHGSPEYISENADLIATRDKDGSLLLFRWNGRKYENVEIPFKREVYSKITSPLDLDLNGWRPYRHLRYTSIQTTKDGRLAVKIQYSRSERTEELAGPKSMTYREIDKSHCIVIWDLLNPIETPLFVGDEVLRQYSRSMISLVESGPAVIIAANPESLLIWDPVENKKVETPYSMAMNLPFQFIWKLETTSDLSKLGIATETGVLVLDLKSSAVSRR